MTARPVLLLCSVAALAALTACGTSSPPPVPAPTGAATTAAVPAPAAPVPAGNGDSDYLRTIHAAGIPVHDDQSALIGGRGVCQSFDDGDSAADVIVAEQRSGGYSQQQAQIIMTAAVRDFCAEHASKLGN